VCCEMNEILGPVLFLKLFADLSIFCRGAWDLYFSIEFNVPIHP